jgi:hypothetical protein
MVQMRRNCHTVARKCSIAEEVRSRGTEAAAELGAKSSLSKFAEDREKVMVAV